MKFRAQCDLFDDPEGVFGLTCDDASLAQQSEAPATDINYIVKRFLESGHLPERHMPPLNGDFQAVESFQDAMNLMIEAQRSFEALDADVRYRFRNDPVRFVDFCSDPANLPELRKLGLANPEPPAAAPAVPVST